MTLNALSRHVRMGIAIAAAALMAACASTQPLECPVVPAPAPVASAAQIAAVSSARGQLDGAIRQYERADYVGAIRDLQAAPDVWTADLDIRTTAFKYLAFSYCATNRRASCRQAFNSLLRLDPDFELRPTEAGHPIWGPIFQQARRSQGA